jgi:hypothetical protein
MYWEYTTSATIAHDRDSAEKVFRIGKFAWDNLDPQIQMDFHAKYDNVRELFFESNQSNYFVGLKARGATIHRLHVSEVAFVKDFDELVASTFETVPHNGVIILESTANGFNHFYDIWNEAINKKSEFTPHFYNWMWDDTYKETPQGTEWKEEYKELAKKYNLMEDIMGRLGANEEQFYWYYQKARRLKDKVKQEYPCNPTEAFLSSYGAVFDLYKVAQIEAKTPITHLSGFRIYKNPEDHRYIIGIDTAEGVEADSTSIIILDANTLEVVGVFNDDTIRPDQIADLAVRMARVYKNAFIIPERNGSGLTTVLKLQEGGYNNIYRERSVDRILKETKEYLGWRTTKVSRDLMIDDFTEIFDEGLVTLNDSEVIGQMMTFVRKDNGRREHEDGKHDDLLFALFLAVQGLKYHRTKSAFIDFYSHEYGNTGSDPQSFLETVKRSGIARIS